MVHTKYVNLVALFVVIIAIPILIVGLQQRQSLKNNAQTKVFTPKNIIEEISVDTSVAGKVGLSWHTNAPSTSLVTYGESENFLSKIQTESVQPIVEHSIQLSDLKPHTTYYFRITAYDEAGSSYTSSIGVFTTQ